MRAILVLSVLGIALVSGQCYTFYEGLCPGSSTCMCTLGESCGSSSGSGSSSSGGTFNKTEGYLRARRPDGGCAGSCMNVQSGECPGDSSCMMAVSSCGAGPNPPPPNPPPPNPPPPGSGSVGGDISEPTSTSAFQCAVSNGWSFVIVRSYKSYGAPDTTAPATIQAASAAGISSIDVYHFPCAGSDAAAQVQADVSAVGQGNFGVMWFDIETNPSSGCGWSSDQSSNCQFLQSMIDAGSSLGISMGVYSSSYMWSSIMGSSCTVGSSLPLWYAHYDGQQTFSDFTPFGGWSSPSLKQYWDSVGICGISADADWYA